MEIEDDIGLALMRIAEALREIEHAEEGVFTAEDRTSIAWARDSLRSAQHELAQLLVRRATDE
jgi:hypothetical protein